MASSLGFVADPPARHPKRRLHQQQTLQSRWGGGKIAGVNECGTSAVKAGLSRRSGAESLRSPLPLLFHSEPHQTGHGDGHRDPCDAGRPAPSVEDEPEDGGADEPAGEVAG
jgi:hypothetical protein